MPRPRKVRVRSQPGPRPRLGSLPKQKVPKKGDRSAQEFVLQQFEKDEEYPVVRGWHDEIDWTMSTGLPSLDLVSSRDKDGLFGIPAGGVIVVVGNAKQGKSTMALSLIKSAQQSDPLGRRPDMIVMLQETEGGFLTRQRLIQYGVDVENMLEEHPETLEDALESYRRKLMVIDQLPPEKRLPLICLVDSISNLDTRAGMAQEHIADSGSLAANSVVLSRFFRRITPLMRRTKSILVLMAQAKTKLMPGVRFMPKGYIGETPIKFEAAIEYVIKKTGTLIDESKQENGIVCKIEVNMSKVDAPGGLAEGINLYFHTGFDYFSSLHDALLKLGIVKRAGNGWTCEKLDIRYVGKSGLGKLDSDTLEKLKNLLMAEAAALPVVAAPEELTESEGDVAEPQDDSAEVPEEAV